MPEQAQNGKAPSAIPAATARPHAAAPLITRHRPNQSLAKQNRKPT